MSNRNKTNGDRKRIGYADPPYPGQSKKHYADHPDYAGEVDHTELLHRLCDEYDGWVLHTSAPALPGLLHTCAEYGFMLPDRILSWVKPFAAFKRNVPLAYTWEPVLIRHARTPVVGGVTKPLRDWYATAPLALPESITMQRGLAGAKPERLCWWIFECLGAQPGDDLDDIFPGSGAVSAAWESWQVRERYDASSLFGEAS